MTWNMGMEGEAPTGGPSSSWTPAGHPGDSPHVMLHPDQFGQIIQALGGQPANPLTQKADRIRKLARVASGAERETTPLLKPDMEGAIAAAAHGQAAADQHAVAHPAPVKTDTGRTPTANEQRLMIKAQTKGK